MNKIDSEEILYEYYIDEVKFLIAIDQGESFITEHRSASSFKKGGTLFYKQEFSYKFDIEFIKNNEEKLLRLGILSKKRVKNI